MKKFLTVFASFCAAALMLFCGCGLVAGTDGLDGRDGKDGTDVSVYDAYEALKRETGNNNLTFEDFLKEYLNFSGGEINSAASLQASINRSLMSAVTIMTRFKYKTTSLLGNGYSYKAFTGSGVILDVDREAGDAYVVTNCHVVYDDTSADANYISEYVRLYLFGQDVEGVNYSFAHDYSVIYDDGYGIEAQVIGASVTYDIAFLKVTGSEVIKRSDAVAASFSDAEDVYIGETVYAIGNAAAEGMSAADGIVSKDSEYIELNLSDKGAANIEYRVLRTTAPINHGNSGGGLFNTNGKIVGIVNSKDDSEDVDNLGYVLPANYVKRLLKLMYDSYNGSLVMGVNKAYLGVVTEVSDSYSRYDSENNRAVISEVVRVKAAQDAPSNSALQAGDICKSVRIVGADGAEKENLKITREYHLRDVMFSVRQGDTVYLTVERGGSETEVAISFNSNSYFRKTA